MTIEYYKQKRTEIAPLLGNKYGAILDLGCGSGSTLAWTKKICKADLAVGIDIEHEGNELARNSMDRLVIGDLNNPNTLANLEGEYDLILALDVLEHLVDPWLTLQQAKSKLAADGRIIISIPNINHWSILRDLIFLDKFEYSNSGILDITHVRFFTRKTIEKMISSADLIAEKHLCHPLSSAGSRSRLINKLSLGFAARFLVTQYIFAVRAPTKDLT